MEDEKNLIFAICISDRILIGTELISVYKKVENEVTLVVDHKKPTVTEVFVITIT